MNRTTQSTLSWTRLIPVLALLALLAQFAVGSAFTPHALAAGTTCVVTPQGTGPHPTIQAAVTDPSCATIRLVKGTYNENVTINRDVAILGLGPSLTTVNGGGVGSVFTINSGTVTLSGLTITNGSAAEGGGIFNNGGTLTVSNSSISGNTAGYEGGGIFNNGTLMVTNSSITGNTSQYTGGGIFNLGTLTIANSTISGNTGTLYSGGIDNEATLTITNSTISGNTAELGGGIFNARTLTISNSTVSGNTATFDGGGIYNFSIAGGTVSLTNTQVVNNTPDDCVGC